MAVILRVGMVLSWAVAQIGGLHSIGVFVLLVGAFLPIMDFFITNVALSSIDVLLYALASELELVIGGYGVVYATLLILNSRLNNHFGHHHLFLNTLIGFMI